MSGDKRGSGMFSNLSARDVAKLTITAFFLPLLAYLIVYGSQNNEGAMVGLGIAMVGVLGAFWGAPHKGSDSDA